MAFCSKCGAKIENGTKFCPMCGAQIEGQANTFGQTGQASQTGQTGWTGQASQTGQAGWTGQASQNGQADQTSQAGWTGQASQNGQADQTGQASQSGQGSSNTTNSFTAAFTNTKDTSSEYTQEEKEKVKVPSILAYFGILFFLPLVMYPDSKYGRFHANQGLLLLITSIALSVVRIILRVIISAIFGLSALFGIGELLKILIGFVCSVPPVVLFVLGIVNAINGKAKELPFIGRSRLIK